jgi:hypothetical protein
MANGKGLYYEMRPGLIWHNSRMMINLFNPTASQDEIIVFFHQVVYVSSYFDLICLYIATSLDWP